jgi:hypothetical protein
VPHRFQYTPGTPLDATPASGTVAFVNTNDAIPVLLPAVQAAQSPQQKHNSQTNINCIHLFLSFKPFLRAYPLLMPTNEKGKYFTKNALPCIKLIL